MKKGLSGFFWIKRVQLIWDLGDIHPETSNTASKHGQFHIACKVDHTVHITRVLRVNVSCKRSLSFQHCMIISVVCIICYVNQKGFNTCFCACVSIFLFSPQANRIAVLTNHVCLPLRCPFFLFWWTSLFLHCFFLHICLFVSPFHSFASFALFF